MAICMGYNLPFREIHKRHYLLASVTFHHNSFQHQCIHYSAVSHITLDLIVKASGTVALTKNCIAITLHIAIYLLKNLTDHLHT